MELRLGLIGCGTVGSAFGGLLAERRAALERLFGVILVLDQVAVARPGRPRPTVGAARVHGDPARLAEDPTLDIVVEATGALEAARWLRVVLDRGAAAVTANKQALVHDPHLLRALARHEPRLHCEAAAAAAVPIVRALRDSLAADRVLTLRGVLNGTTTFVLSRIEEGARLAHAVAEAQRAGYAEADPADDLEGRDAAAKLAILCTVAWREPVGLDAIATRGLETGIEEEVRSAQSAGRRVRLVARARRLDTADLDAAPVADDDATTGGRTATDEDATTNRGATPRAKPAPQALQAAVAVESLDPDDPLGLTRGVDSMVEVETAQAGRLLWSGPGAGGRATASALLADTLAAARALAQERTGRLEVEPAR
jgi:homoserine dehydrogenase